MHEPATQRQIEIPEPSTQKQIEIPIQLGEPVEHRGVVVVPLFPRLKPRAQYVTLEEALPLGFRVAEVDAAGSVPELAVANPLDSNVLLYDGEELLGAKQNRILNVTVLVAAQSETRIPVSCVEEGRWHARSALLRRRSARRLPGAPPPQGGAALGSSARARRRAGRGLAGALARRRGGSASTRRPVLRQTSSPLVSAT